ncbi:MAG: 50S ribosomal protein L15 [Bacteroidota bacterium]
MELHNLKPAKGAVKKDKRIGRGTGSGHGGTSTRGHKGAQSRSGYSRKAGFEGGQMPLQRRLPKFGFKNINRVEFTGINLDVLQQLAERNITEFNHDVFVKNGLASRKDKVKILGRGELKSVVSVTAHAFSATAKEAIEKAGGTAIEKTGFAEIAK